MNWFERICRNTGLMLHNIAHPSGAAQRQVIRKEHEERKPNSTVTLRRTTIEEIEVKRDGEDPTSGTAH